MSLSLAVCFASLESTSRTVTDICFLGVVQDPVLDGHLHTFQIKGEMYCEEMSDRGVTNRKQQLDVRCMLYT